MPGDKEANLARIRDNQRRSRERRKLYLQELEGKYRNCERVGAQASAEIQAAARRVLFENRRLRALLRKRGITDAEVESFSLDGTEPAHSTASVPELRNMLESVKPCTEKASSTVGVWIRRPDAIVPNACATTPEDTAGCKQEDAIGQQDPLGSPPTPLSAILQTPVCSAPPDVQRLAPAPAPTPTPTPFGLSEVSFGFQHSPQAAWSHNEDSSPCIDAANYPAGGTSCLYTADMIRGIGSSAGPELEADLGCNRPGAECVVDNFIVFNVMEKYANRVPGT